MLRNILQKRSVKPNAGALARYDAFLLLRRSLASKLKRSPSKTGLRMLPGRIIPFSNHPTQTNAAEETPLSIVQVGRDRELSRLRERVLASAGYSVQSISPEESTALDKVPEANCVWVFCHTVEFYEFALIAGAVRRIRPADKLLRMNGLEDVGQAAGLFDELLQPIEGVDGLLRAVAELSTP